MLHHIPQELIYIYTLYTVYIYYTQPNTGSFWINQMSKDWANKRTHLFYAGYAIWGLIKNINIKNVNRKIWLLVKVSATLGPLVLAETLDICQTLQFTTFKKKKYWIESSSPSEALLILFSRQKINRHILKWFLFLISSEMFSPWSLLSGHFRVFPI